MTHPSVKRFPRLKACLLLLTLAGGAISGMAAAQTSAPARTLKPFASEKELLDLFSRWAEENKQRLEEMRRQRAADANVASVQAVPQPAPMASAKAGPAAAAESVTNVQQAGVDEGGIVKVHGDHLVVLRRGRLSTVSIRDGALAPVASVDAFGPGIDPRGAWYDEMLLWGNTVAVIGYSYARGGTEIGLFDLSASGEIAYKGTYHLRSNDYYSSRNYASRLIGSKLIFYSPLRINPYATDMGSALPAFRKWTGNAAPADFRRIAPATRIYRTDEPLDPIGGVALHTVSVCDLARPEFSCESTAVLGPPGRVFYVSAESVYVWTTPWRGRSDAGSSVFRIPLSGAAPTALKTAGSPVDQFSFLERNDGYLNVLLRAQGRGDGMWAAEMRAGDFALLRVPLASFSDGKDSAPPQAYRALPRPQGGALQNRYVGEYLLYGAGAGWREPRHFRESQVYAVRFAHDPQAYEIALPHGVDRIEALGTGAVVIGSGGGDLHFTSVRLSGVPVSTGRYTRRNAAQGETRSHGFFYKPESEYDGLVGLPIIGGSESARGQLAKPSASVLFLRNRSLALNELGALDSRAAANANDGCRASCVDWYGNSRPLFLRNRVFALMGYEIVEGRLRGDNLDEVRRVSFAPRVAEIAR